MIEWIDKSVQPLIRGGTHHGDNTTRGERNQVRATARGKDLRRPHTDLEPLRDANRRQTIRPSVCSPPPPGQTLRPRVRDARGGVARPRWLRDPYGLR